MNNYISSLIRTLVPIGVGAVITWVQIRFGLTIDGEASATLAAMVTALTIGLYYAGVRWAETRFPQVGWLLGLPKAPGYSTEDAPPPQPSPGSNPDV